MFVKRLLQKATAEVPIPAGNLRDTYLDPQLAVHQGIPSTASVLAFEPVQRLLAVATSDGQIKLLGVTGIEVLLQSPLRLPCKFLEFVNNRGLLVQVTTQNDIELWDVDSRELTDCLKWEAEIISFAVLQGSPFMYIGDHTGTVAVLEYLPQDQRVNVLPYCIPANIALGGLVRAGSSDAPPVVGILPQPDIFFSRLVIAYGNGLLLLWGLHESRALAVRGGTETQRDWLAQHRASLSGERRVPSPPKSVSSEEDEEEKEICCVCWACPVGSLLTVGYTDGDIWQWGIPAIAKGKTPSDFEVIEGPISSGTPMRKIDLSPGMPKMPVILLNWCSSAKVAKGGSGRLYVFGGGEVGKPEVLTVLFSDSMEQESRSGKLLKLELSLPGAFADMALLPPAGGGLGTPAAAFVILMMPGLLHVYDEAGIADYFSALAEGMPSPLFPQPVPLQLPVTKSKVTCAKLVLVSNDGMAAKRLLQLPRMTASAIPFILLAGTKLPISGGSLKDNATSSGGHNQAGIFITGHEDGHVKFWDASSPSYGLICTVESPSKTELDGAAVSAFEFCVDSGCLAVGDNHGLVSFYTYRNDARQVLCHIFNDYHSPGKEEVHTYEAGFQRTFIINIQHQAIQTIAVARFPPRLALGDGMGMVSLLDLETPTILFHENCFSTTSSGILSLAFAATSVYSDGTPSSLSPTAKSKSYLPHGNVTVLYVLSNDSSMITLDGTTGVLIGPGPVQPKKSSTAVTMHLLDAAGFSLTSVPRAHHECTVDNYSFQDGGNSRKSPDDQEDHLHSPSTSGQEESPKKLFLEDHFVDSLNYGSRSEAIFLLLCSNDSLRLYSTSAILQGFRTTLRKVKLEKTCCWTSTFHVNSTSASGLVLMYSSGQVEFRSLPDLSLIKELSLATCLNGKLEPTPSSLKTITCNNEAQLGLIYQEREYILLSILEEDNLRHQVKLTKLYDQDLAVAAIAAITASTSLPKKKSQTQGMQGLLGGVLKELKNVLDPEQLPVVHIASELPKLFNSCPFTIIPLNPAHAVRLDTLGSLMNSSSMILDIDDIDVEQSDVGSTAVPAESSTSKFSSKFKWSLKGKEKKNDGEDRLKLFEDRKDDNVPRSRTADEIKAKYGHKKSLEVTSIAGQARDKLLERQEKLQAISQRTEEMQAGAENFASMAEELAKKMESKKWWEL